MKTHHYLEQALELAKIRRGFCAPNPSVGAVVVKDNQTIATGYHFAAGHPHAEVEALNKINDVAKDATLYVTLEPCCHREKKTPPCTDLIIERGIKKVIYAFRDPNPFVAGLGEKTLRDAGIECMQIALPEIDAFYQSYQYWWQTKKPFITAKLAISLDGKIAGANGERISITGAAAQQFTHQQRKQADAILTTAKTIHADNPLLNVRLDNSEYKKPIYILDSELNIPLDAKIFSTAKNITIFHKKNISSKKINARLIAVDHDDSNLNLTEIIGIIGGDGIHDLWIEAGGNCFSAFTQKHLLHHAFIYVAPKTLGTNAQPAFSTKQNLFKEVKKTSWQSLGDDVACEMWW